MRLFTGWCSKDVAFHRQDNALLILYLFSFFIVCVFQIYMHIESVRSLKLVPFGKMGNLDVFVQNKPKLSAEYSDEGKFIYTAGLN